MSQRFLLGRTTMYTSTDHINYDNTSFPVTSSHSPAPHLILHCIALLPIPSPRSVLRLLVPQPLALLPIPLPHSVSRRLVPQPLVSFPIPLPHSLSICLGPHCLPLFCCCCQCGGTRECDGRWEWETKWVKRWCASKKSHMMCVRASAPNFKKYKRNRLSCGHTSRKTLEEIVESHRTPKSMQSSIDACSLGVYYAIYVDSMGFLCSLCWLYFYIFTIIFYGKNTSLLMKTERGGPEALTGNLPSSMRGSLYLIRSPTFTQMKMCGPRSPNCHPRSPICQKQTWYRFIRHAPINPLLTYITSFS